MNNVKVVIGANFGDEGKGLMTDYFASKGNTAKNLVVRFNGGAQAGHTVVTPDGKEHVFSHFGSGTLAGVATYLSKHFLVNPVMFYPERESLLSKVEDGVLPEIHIDPRAYITTPYDMWLNQVAESLRGNGRHGSCGLGISETVVRSENPAYCLTYESVLDSDYASLRDKLLRIRDDYVPLRLTELGFSLSQVSKSMRDILGSSSLLDVYLDDCRYVRANSYSNASFNMGVYETIVFEGAQGLLLDQDLEEFSPYITHTSTGLKNVVDILSDQSFDYAMEVAYVTRSYLTRHGAGPLFTELPAIPYPNVEDKTNIPNEWQGSLRFGWLDIDLLEKYIVADFKTYAPEGAELSLSVTCVDQLDAEAIVTHNEELHTIPSEDLSTCLKGIISKWVPVKNLYESRGRTRSTISCN